MIAGTKNGTLTGPNLQYVYMKEIGAMPPQDPMAVKASQGKYTVNFRRLEEHIYRRLKAELADRELVIIYNVMSVRLNLPFTAALHRLISESQNNSEQRFVVYTHNVEQGIHPEGPLSLLILRVDLPNVTYATVSRYYRNGISQMYGISEKRIHILNPGIQTYSPLQMTREALEDFRREHLFDQDLVLVFPSRVDWNKDMGRALAILETLCRIVPKTKLVFAVPGVVWLLSRPGGNHARHTRSRTAKGTGTLAPRWPPNMPSFSIRRRSLLILRRTANISWISLHCPTLFFSLPIWKRLACRPLKRLL